MPEAARKTPLVIAHRGASGYLPEHSLPAKALALGMGADYLEQDVIASRDGELLVLHDLILDHVSDVAGKFPDRRRNDGHFYCIDFDLQEILTLEFTERVRADTNRLRYPGRFPREAGGFRVVTLREELRFIRGVNNATNRTIGIFTEIKFPAWHREQGMDLTAKVLNVLEEFSYLREGASILLACFDSSELKKVRAQAGAALPIVQLLSSKTLVDDDLLRDVASYADGLGPSIPLIYAGKNGAGQPRLTDLARHANALGLAIYPYTFRADDLPEGIGTFEELLEIFVERVRVDGLISDFPDRVVAFLERGLARA